MVPFRWDIGPNSEALRRAAAAELLNLCKDDEAKGVDYHLIGHSHGGSVVYNALLQSVDQEVTLNHLRQWITIGTPFLDDRMNRFMFQRLTGLGLTIYTTGLAAILIAMTYWIFGTSGTFDVEGYAKVGGLSDAMIQSALEMDLDTLLHEFAVALMVYAGLCLLALTFLERRKRGRFTAAEKRQVETVFGERWLGLWHQEDEVISALFNVKSVSGNIIPHTFLAPVVSYLQLLVVGLLCAIVVFDTMLGEGHIISGLAFDVGGPMSTWNEETGTFDDMDGLDNWGDITLMIVVMLGGAGFFVWVMTLLFKGIATVVGYPLAFVFNRVIWTSVRQRTWGDDLPVEDVRDIAPRPPEFECGFACLPDVVSVPLRDHSDHHAITTLNKVRLLMGMSEGGSVRSDMRSELGEALNWQELIHTSYFEVPAFVDLIALALNRAGLGPMRPDAGLSAVDAQVLTRWLDDARTQAA